MYFNDDITTREKFLCDNYAVKASTSDLPRETCEALTAAGFTSYHELWERLYVKQENIAGLTVTMLHQINAFFLGNGCETRPSSGERFYSAILGRLAQRGEINKPKGGIAAFLRQHFRSKAGDKHTIALHLSDKCGLPFDVRAPLMEYYELTISPSATKSQMARRYGVSVAEINRMLANAEEAVVESGDMLQWMREEHPEAWPAA